MADPWKRLQVAASAALNWAWDDLAQRGEETALFAPMAKFPQASGWLASRMAMSDDSVTRKLAAMLGGWLIDGEHNRDLLDSMLNHERETAVKNMLDANSVVEDIMFAATRWSSASSDVARSAGRSVLAEIVRDAIAGTNWNTAHWAFANLYAVTDGSDPAIAEAMDATDGQLDGQQFLASAIAAVRSNDATAIARTVTPPNPAVELSPGNPGRPLAVELWDALADAEIAANA